MKQAYVDKRCIGTQHTHVRMHAHTQAHTHRENYPFLDLLQGETIKITRTSFYRLDSLPVAQLYQM